MILALAVLGIVLAAIPAGMFLQNLPLFRVDLDRIEKAETNQEAVTYAPAVSVLIPARDEQAGIEACVNAALASRGVDVEVVVLDDHSTDQTADLVKAIAARDSRVRCLAGQSLPPGWNGKQFACSQLAAAAAQDVWVFLDADVRLQPHALRELVAYLQSRDLDLLSAFPHQETGTWLEAWLVPMMHVILLGYLPLRQMRENDQEAFAAGCGQLFMTRRGPYQAAGTHAAIKASRHDGLKLPRAYRRAGLKTDVIDGTALASCRMYHSARQVVLGVLKNAHEGIASARLIVPFSVLLLGSAVLPVITLVWAVGWGRWEGVIASLIGVGLGHLPRAAAAMKFRQPWSGVVFHSLATLLFIGLQWWAFGMHARGRSVAWRGRVGS